MTGLLFQYALHVLEIGLDSAPVLVYNWVINPPVSSGTGCETVLSEYGLCLSREGGRMKTWIYIDGFNLYYGAVKDTPYRWLDLHKMCQLLLPGHQIARIKYFTARVSGRSNDLSQPTRQQTYLRALRTLANLEIISPARAPAYTRRSSCAMATRSATAARACSTQSTTSTPSSPTS